MDAVIYIRDMQRMCKSRISCNGCELKPGNGKSCMEGMDPQKCISVVEQWASEHSIKTRQSVFLEQYPETKILEDGAIVICPLAVSAAYREKKEKDGSCASLRFGACDECRKAFWLAEVEDA